MSYKVIQWATGNVGQLALRGIIEHPDLELVGLLVHSADKAGRDAGEIAGLSGELATLRQQLAEHDAAGDRAEQI